MNETPPSPENRCKVAGTGAFVAVVIVIAVLVVVLAVPAFIVVAYLVAL
ncbi:hypothetical protein DFR67_101239 [Williamsia limnetica]|uniref:Uncharacterized protein n=1 Tax=Williamsia limnetica TaxID=882452 RepID=A0A318RPP2_WILLI|nr:hypothetical protein [Williamsia limnetica]PYE20848.1 hypothetical protein DFR67_101239 [Williamsia limnetica]